VNKAMSEEKGDELEDITLGEHNSLKVPEEFPLCWIILVVSLFLVWLVM